jgi:hypothetical protein
MTYRDFLEQFLDMEGSFEHDNDFNQRGFLYLFVVNADPIGDSKRAVLTEVGDKYVILSFEEGYMQSYPQSLFSVQFEESDLEEDNDDDNTEEEGEN